MKCQRIKRGVCSGCYTTSITKEQKNVTAENQRRMVLEHLRNERVKKKLRELWGGGRGKGSKMLGVLDYRNRFWNSANCQGEETRKKLLEWAKERNEGASGSKPARREKITTGFGSGGCSTVLMHQTKLGQFDYWLSDKGSGQSLQSPSATLCHAWPYLAILGHTYLPSSCAIAFSLFSRCNIFNNSTRKYKKKRVQRGAY